MPAFNSRDYMEAMAKANKHGGMLYPVSPGVSPFQARPIIADTHM